MGEAATEKIKPTPAGRFWKIIKNDAKEIRHVYYYSIFVGLVSLSLPLGIQAIINLIQGAKVSSAWIVVVIFVVFGIAVSGVLQILQLRITENLQQKIYARASFELAHRVPRIKMEELFQKYAPELMNRFFDTLTVQKGLAKILIDISTAGIQVAFGLILLSLYHPFFIIFSVLLVVLLYAIFKFTGRRGLETSLTESKHKYKTAHWLEEVARTANSFRLVGKSSLPLKLIDKHVDNYTEAREDHFRVLVTQYSLLVIFKVIVATGLLAIGGILVMEQVMNIGQFVAAEIIILLIIASVEKLIGSLDTIYDVLTSLEKIGQVTDLELENTEGVDIQEETDTSKGIMVNLNNLTFSYPGSSFEVLREINLNIEAGEHVMVTGANGSGKSTLLHLLAGLYPCSDGVVAYNKFPLENLNIEKFRASIGACLSYDNLFEGTLIDNITMGRDNIEMKDVKWAVEAVGLTNYIKDLPDGYTTQIEPYGAKLSKNIIQRILIARTVINRPKLLLLEYALEELDPEVKETIINFLFDPKNAWTIIAASTSHRLAEKCDKIVIMDKGTVKKVGTFDQLKNDI